MIFSAVDDGCRYDDVTMDMLVVVVVVVSRPFVCSVCFVARCMKNRGDTVPTTMSKPRESSTEYKNKDNRE
jgi:hypothetical protein